MHPDIRTYGRIHGRTDRTWPFDTTMPPDWYIMHMPHIPIIVPHDRPVILEIGCGMGDSLWAMCQSHKDILFIGVEIYRPGLLKLATRMQTSPLDNLIIIQGDALAVLQDLPVDSIDRIHVFFPDPWPKLRHHKRRLHRGPFFSRLLGPLKKIGRIHLATDIPEYADDWAKHVPSAWKIDTSDAWIHHRAHTKYEARGERLGHNITDLVYSVE